MSEIEELQNRLRSEGAAIHAMHYRQYQWLRWIPFLEVLWNKPWRSSASLSVAWHSGRTLRAKLSNAYGWLRMAHDCADPAVACSCHGGYRFPHRGGCCNTQQENASDV